MELNTSHFRMGKTNAYLTPQTLGEAQSHLELALSLCEDKTPSNERKHKYLLNKVFGIYQS